MRSCVANTPGVALRLIRARSCCPMESLWIENRRNAIGIETDPAFSTSLMVFSALKGENWGTALNLAKNEQSALLKRRPAGVFAVVSLDRRTDN